MPYVICGDCELLTYSAALWASTEECPRCGAPLPIVRRTELLDDRSRTDEALGTHAEGDDA